MSKNIKEIKKIIKKNEKRGKKMRLKTIFLFVICLSLIFCVSTQKKIEKARKNDPQYQYNLGLFHLNNGNIDEADKYFNKAISLNDKYYLAYNSLGLAYSMRGDLQKSLKYFKKCLEINPGFTEARNNLGIIYQEMGFINKAEDEFYKVLSDKTYSSKELPYYNLAYLFFIKNKFEQALDYVQNSIRENSSFAMAYNLKGLLLEKLDDLPQAIKSYEKALSIVPADINFSFNLAVALFKSQELSRAKEIFERISPKVSDPEMKNKINQYLKIMK